MDKDKIQEIRDYAEAAANLMPYEDDDVIFSGIEIMELLDHLASKEAEVDAQREELERLREALEFYADEKNWLTDDYDLVAGWTAYTEIEKDNGETARCVLAEEEK